MKYLILMLLSFEVNAVTLGRFISLPDGSSLQEFDLQGEKGVYQKRSNFFDKKEDLTLGKFEFKSNEIASVEKKLEKTLDKINEVDAFLQKKNSSFNDLSNKKNHESLIMLDSFRISQDSKLYPEQKNLFDELLDKEWTLKDGIKISKDLKTVTYYKNGKAVSSEPFNMAFQCQKPEKPTVCSFKELGMIYIK